MIADTSRLNQVIEHESGDQVVRVQAGLGRELPVLVLDDQEPRQLLA